MWGKIFATVPPEEEYLHLFLSEEQREEALALDPAWAEKLFWGGKVAGLRVRFGAAPAASLRELARSAWEAKAPAKLRAMEPGRTAEKIAQAAPASAGYSGTPLVQKLGIREGMRLAALQAPPDYPEILGALPPGVEIGRKATPKTDLAHLFVTTRVALAAALPSLRSTLRDDAVLWVSWPKKASKVETDIAEGTIRDLALPLGFVDVKVCAVTEVWSGLKLVVRKELRVEPVEAKKGGRR